MADVWPPAGDKCEANYAVVPFVAEFWSTLTAVAFVPAGLLMLLYVICSRPRPAPTSPRSS